MWLLNLKNILQSIRKKPHGRILREKPKKQYLSIILKSYPFIYIKAWLNKWALEKHCNPPNQTARETIGFTNEYKSCVAHNNLKPSINGSHLKSFCLR